MQTNLAMLILATGFIALVAFSPIVVAAGSNQGFVVYQVAVTNSQQTNRSFVINETVVPSAKSGFSIVSLALIDSSWNVTFSKLLNTSAFPELLPFIPAVSNQSFSYSRGGYTVNVHFANIGRAPITFDGVSYTGNNYSLVVTVTNSTMRSTFHGAFLTTPSGLLYSATLSGESGSMVNVKLESTNLSITDSTAATSVEGATIISVGLVGAAALAVPFWKFSRKRNVVQRPTEEKPSHWVD
jgi:hypothetical protein